MIGAKKRSPIQRFNHLLLFHVNPTQNRIGRQKDPRAQKCVQKCLATAQYGLINQSGYTYKKQNEF